MQRGLARVSLAAVLFACAVAFAGCAGDPAGLIRIHFALESPLVIDLDEEEPPPVDPLDLQGAAGTVEVLVAEDVLESEMTGLPTPESPHVMYRLWLSDSERGGGWVLAGVVEPLATGAGSLHVTEDDVDFHLHDVRAAIVTLDEHGSDEPSHFVALTGAVGEEEEVELPSTGGTGGGGHQH